MGKTCIHYFTGTGNSRRAVDILERELKKSGQECVIRLIEKDSRPMIDGCDAHILIFPVYSWTLPALVQRYVRRFKGVSGIKAASLAICGGGAFQASAQARRMLSRRGLNVVIDFEAIYPDNWTQMMSPPAGAAMETMLNGGDQAVLEFARLWQAGQTYTHKYSPALGLLGWLIGGAFITLGRRILGKFYIADSSCNGCSLCAKACPAGCITMKARGTVPAWKFNCEDCCRCINICPQKSIQFSLFRVVSLCVVTALFFAVFSLTWPLLALLLPMVPANVSGFSGVLVLSVLAFAAHSMLIDPLLIALRGRKPFRDWLDWTFTRGFNRYMAPGWKPLEKK